MTHLDKGRGIVVIQMQIQIRSDIDCESFVNTWDLFPGSVVHEAFQAKTKAEILTHETEARSRHLPVDSRRVQGINMMRRPKNQD